jgi:hypothetical protein
MAHPDLNVAAAHEWRFSRAVVRRRWRSVGLVAIAAAALAAPAVAARPTIAVDPNSVHRGQFVRVHGIVPGCPRGDQVTLLSRAFSHAHEFAGIPAVFAHVGRHHRYFIRTRIPAGRRLGRYRVSGRCGGGNLGVSARLRVLAYEDSAKSTSRL